MISEIFFGSEETFCKVKFKNMILSAILIMVTLTLVGAMDTIMAAQLCGDSAMAGINLTKPILFFAAFLALMVSTGTSYLYSFEIGAFNNEKANKLIGQGAISTIILSILIGIIVFLGEEIFFSFFPNLGASESFAHEYYKLLPLIVALNTLYILMQMIVFSDGGGKNCVIATVAQFVVNFLASITLGLKFGVFGIALGTVIGYFASILIFAKWIFFESLTLKPILFFSVSEIVKILKYS